MIMNVAPSGASVNSWLQFSREKSELMKHTTVIKMSYLFGVEPHSRAKNRSPLGLSQVFGLKHLKEHRFVLMEEVSCALQHMYATPSYRAFPLRENFLKERHSFCPFLLISLQPCCHILYHMTRNESCQTFHLEQA